MSSDVRWHIRDKIYDALNHLKLIWSGWLYNELEKGCVLSTLITFKARGGVAGVVVPGAGDVKEARQENLSPPHRSPDVLSQLHQVVGDTPPP